MRKFVISLVAAAVTAAPIQAATWQDQGSEARRGAFIGAQFTISLAGRDHRRPRAQLAIAPTQTRISSNGIRQTRIGEGIALGFSPGGNPALTLAGTRADMALHPQRENSNDPGRLGISSTGWIAIGLGVAALAGGVYFIHLVHEADKNSD